MATNKSIFTPETFRFFRELSRHNRKAWMDANRERYQAQVVAPFRRLLADLSQSVLALGANFDTSGRTGANFSRINRDIRFAKDKTPYRTQMYLMFPAIFPGGEAGQLYVGLSADTVTAGFRIYSGGERKTSALALLAAPRAAQDSRWLARQKKRLGRRYESYWYSTNKGEWTKHDGWPASAEEWKKIQGWIVRRKMKPAAAARVSFPYDVTKIFRELFPLVRFTSLRD